MPRKVSKVSTLDGLIGKLSVLHNVYGMQLAEPTVKKSSQMAHYN